MKVTPSFKIILTKKLKIQKYNQNIIKSYKKERINFLDFEQKFNSKDYIKKRKIINKIIFVNKLINKMNTKNIEKLYIFKILKEKTLSLKL